jgi:V-type H+-transporting ATPase subunit F
MALHKEGSQGALIGVIGDEDSVTGFLLAGVGNVDVRRKSNFLIVDSSEYPTPLPQSNPK